MHAHRLECSWLTLLTLLLLLPSCAVSQTELRLPPRPGSALRGSELRTQVLGKSLAERERLVLHEINSGNLPQHLRRMVPVQLQARIGGKLRTATIWCTPDYLGVGQDADWFRMPLTPQSAQEIADRLDCVLPTRRMVDAIWKQAAVKLQPAPFSPSSYRITSAATFYLSHLKIESQLGQRQGLLVAGIKKDIVASALIARWPQRVVIYGWHYPSGRAIQPLSKVHHSSYVDYSHGVRLVARRCLVDGAPSSVDAVLADPVLHVLLSDEGPVSSWRYAVRPQESLPLRDSFPASGPELAGWRPKFTTPRLVSVSPLPPSRDRVALRIMDSAGGTESILFDVGQVRDLAVQATLLCEHRPSLANDGFERIGIFTRDRGQGSFDGTMTQAGACYALTWDSSDGRLRCLRVMGSQTLDLLPSPRYVPGTAWRRFRIETRGTELRFFLDGKELLRTRDSSHKYGHCGIGYHEYFRSNAHAKGTRADAFWADAHGSLDLNLRSERRGELRLERRRGVPNQLYLSCLALSRGAYPQGWFFGIDPSPAELSLALASGHPWFIGQFDAQGRADALISGLNPKLELFGVLLDLDPSLLSLRASRPRSIRLR
ncbi:MAG: hypothetical protein CSA62_00840 [Planctomycetota bacterium]|nr:MAG: hypothetical protein CSA62_00840 [Planctomycetota bacterium]